ncbi:MAG: DUF4393 domain-containing protein [Phyllobacteriaceae bacterium]|nr:DUF4393 domain-containing protein [Phyllobacteriaceae bacterium]
MQKIGIAPAVDEAAAEVIKVAAGETASGLVGFSKDLLGAIIGDRVREWRTRNLISSAAKTADFLKEKGIPLDRCHSLPTGEIYALFEGMSRSDEPEIQALYAGLLANSLTSDVHDKRAIVSVLANLTPLEARILEAMQEIDAALSDYNRRWPPMQVFEATEDVEGQSRKLMEEDQSTLTNKTKAVVDAIMSGVTEERVLFAIQNLVRQGLAQRSDVTFDRIHKWDLEPHFSEIKGYVDPDRLADRLNDIIVSMSEQQDQDIADARLVSDYGAVPSLNFSLTRFGHQFVAACTGPKTSPQS